MNYIENPKFKLKFHNSLGKRDFKYCPVCGEQDKIRYKLYFNKSCILIDKVSECLKCDDDFIEGSIGFIWFQYWYFNKKDIE